MIELLNGDRAPGFSKHDKAVRMLAKDPAGVAPRVPPTAVPTTTTAKQGEHRKTSQTTTWFTSMFVETNLFRIRKKADDFSHRSLYQAR